MTHYLIHGHIITRPLSMGHYHSIGCITGSGDTLRASFISFSHSVERNFVCVLGDRNNTMMGLQFWFTAPILDDEYDKPQCRHSNDQDDDE